MAQKAPAAGIDSLEHLTPLFQGQRGGRRVWNPTPISATAPKTGAVLSQRGRLSVVLVEHSSCRVETNTVCPMSHPFRCKRKGAAVCASYSNHSHVCRAARVQQLTLRPNTCTLSSTVSLPMAERGLRPRQRRATTDGCGAASSAPP